MSLCALNINRDIYQKHFKSESDVYHQKIGYSFPHYVLENDKKKAQKIYSRIIRRQNLKYGGINKRVWVSKNRRTEKTIYGCP